MDIGEISTDNATKASNPQFSRQVADEYRDELHRFLVRRLRYSSLSAHDVAQETFLRLLRVEHTSLIRKPRAYLYRIALNVIRELELKEQVNPLSGAVDGLDPDDLIPSRGTEVDRVEHASSLRAALDGLPDMQKAALLLLKRDGKSYEEIARCLNLSVHTVKKYLFRAVTHCRKNGWR